MQWTTTSLLFEMLFEILARYLKQLPTIWYLNTIWNSLDLHYFTILCKQLTWLCVPTLFVGHSYTRAHATRNNNQILHGDQTGCEENFYCRFDHECWRAICLRQLTLFRLVIAKTTQTFSENKAICDRKWVIKSTTCSPQNVGNFNACKNKEQKQMLRKKYAM